MKFSSVRRAFIIQSAMLLSTVVSANAYAKGILEEIKSRKELRVGIEPGFIPFEMKKPSGEWIGFDIDMVSAFAQELGAKPVFVDTKFDGIIPSLQTKKFDMIVSGMTITEERSRVVKFSDPYFKAGLTILLSQKNLDAVKSTVELNDPKFTVAVKLGTTSDTYATKSLPKANVKKFDSEADAANAVLLGKVDAFVYDKPYIQLFSKRHVGKVGVRLETLTAENFGVAVRKVDTELSDAFSAFLKKWRDSGKYDAAIKTHFEEMPWLKDFPNLK